MSQNYAKTLPFAAPLHIKPKNIKNYLHRNFQVFQVIFKHVQVFLFWPSKNNKNNKVTKISKFSFNIFIISLKWTFLCLLWLFFCSNFLHVIFFTKKIRTGKFFILICSWNIFILNFSMKQNIMVKGWIHFWFSPNLQTITFFTWKFIQNKIITFFEKFIFIFRNFCKFY